MTGVRMRGMRSHDERAGGALPPLEGEPSVQSGPSQVLRQKTLQVQQQQLHQHATSSSLVIPPHFHWKVFPRVGTAT